MHAPRWTMLLCVVLLPSSMAMAFSTQDCMMCHTDLELERPDGTPWSLSVDLEAFEQSIHGMFSCTDCHTGIDDLPHAEKLPRVDCGSCHVDVMDDYMGSAHGLDHESGRLGEGASCVDCHGAHEVRPASDPLSMVHHHNLASTCIACHEDEALMERHDLLPGERMQSYVLSVHGQANVDDPASTAATCSDCHGWHDIQSHLSPDSSVSRQNVVRTCGQCHVDVMDEFYDSVHGSLGREGNPDVPVCTDCHGEHGIYSALDRESTVSRYQITETCGRCHEDERIVREYKIPIASPSTFYRDSVHGQALLVDGNDDAAACQDCHGHHGILRHDDPRSSIHRRNIPDTCAACHEQETVEYLDSVHGISMLRGVSDAPVCTDCHGEHTIMSHLDPDSPVFPTRMAKEVCGRCHDALVVNRKYGLPTGQVSTYFESYHGLAGRLGDTTVANCASCHGVHDILPSDDERSWVHPDNLIQTCGSCHPGASPAFVSGLVHISPSTAEGWLGPVIRNIYLILIALTIGGMLLHNFIIMFRHIRDKYRSQKKAPYVKRFNRHAVVQHLLLTVAFILLVITGFSLKFPDSLFSIWMTAYMGFGEAQRALSHRVAGVVLTVTLVYHLGCMLFTARGRMELGALMVRFRDAVDAVRNVGYHLGLAREKPRFDRYDYSEKMEYWAFLWGGVIMIITGFLLWFPVWAGQFGISRGWIDIARIIHYYEAWLATLAIVVWHFFFVMFHPEEYPMSMSWLTGKLPVSSMEERHPEELERLERAGEIYRNGEPLPPDASKSSEDQ